METIPDFEDRWYEARRFWYHSSDTWDPVWYQRFGWPHFGNDEWGRRVITVGHTWLGYWSWAFRTCWCQWCHMSREQTYRLAVQHFREYQEKLTRGQCVCDNKEVYRVRQAGGRMFGTCACGHPYPEHDEWGECTHLNVSMDPTEKGPPENLEIGG